MREWTSVEESLGKLDTLKFRLGLIEKQVKKGELNNQETCDEVFYAFRSYMHSMGTKFIIKH